MNIPVFDTIKNYPAMLYRIAICNFIASIVLIYLLRNQIQEIDNLLSPINLTIKISDLELKLINVVVAFVIALFSRMIKLHDRISDVLTIRKDYDIYKIIFPLASLSGANMDSDKIRKIKSNRGLIMHNIFYKYASSTESRCLIDHHSVTMAIDQWSYFWIFLEINFLILLSATTLFFFKLYLWSSILLLIFLIILVIQKILYKECIKYTTNELTEISELPNANTEIKNYLDAL